MLAGAQARRIPAAAYRQGWSKTDHLRRLGTGMRNSAGRVEDSRRTSTQVAALHTSRPFRLELPSETRACNRRGYGAAGLLFRFPNSRRCKTASAPPLVGPPDLGILSNSPPISAWQNS